MLTFVLSSHSLEIPNDASMLLILKSDGCSLLSQGYCKLIGWHWIIMRRKFYTLKCAIVVKFTSLVVCGHIMIASNYWLLQLWMMVKYNLTVFLTYIHIWNITQYVVIKYTQGISNKNLVSFSVWTIQILKTSTPENPWAQNKEANVPD